MLNERRLYAKNLTMILSWRCGCSTAGRACSQTTTAPAEGPRPQACLRGRGLSLLQGAPQTVGMRSGLVRLKSNETVGWHTTGDHEESLIILDGQGKALIKGQRGNRSSPLRWSTFRPQPATMWKTPAKRRGLRLCCCTRQEQVGLIGSVENARLETPHGSVAS